MIVYPLTNFAKFADDTSILGLIKGSDETHYRQLVDSTLA